MILESPFILSFKTFLGLPCVMTLRIWQLLLIHIGIVWIDMMQTGNCSAELFDELQVQLILHIQLYLKKILKDPDMNRLQRQQ